MKKIIVCSILLCYFSSMLLIGQNIWQEIDIDNVPLIQKLPTAYQGFQVDLTELQNILEETPLRFTPQVQEKTIYLSLPSPDGTIAKYKMVEAPIIAEGLAAKYPEIKTYVGINKQNPLARVRCSITSKGFHAVITGANVENYCVQSLSKENKNTCISFYLKDSPFFPEKNATEAIEDDIAQNLPSSDSEELKSIEYDCQLKKYRIAIAAAGEYTQYHGGTVEDALGAIVISLNRANEIFENDLGIHLELIENNDEIIYTSALNDPYTYNAAGAAQVPSQNQSTLDTIIGSENYDIGHVFIIFSGTSATTASVCKDTKARGYTGNLEIQGEPFNLAFCSVLGRQFGAVRTYNNSCGNTNDEFSVEPGGGSTIMGSGGFCAPTVQDFRDPYFHSISIQSIKEYINSEEGNDCGTVISTVNSSPTVEIDTHYYNIPISTPFILSANATDVDNDPLTYCWEQTDTELQTMPPLSTNTGSPLFRSFLPDTNNKRIFPRLEAIINNEMPTWEVLPSIPRIMNFDVTIRDNNLEYGCVTIDSVIVETIEGAGPFLVETPNENVNWYIGFNETITWDVANTDAAPINCSNVDILLSTDGGYTYPILLAENVPNDGMQDIIVPNTIGTNNRVKIACSDNIFFDISDKNFSIETPPTSFLIEATPIEQSVCEEDEITYTISLNVVEGFDETVTLSVNNLPSGTIATFSNPTITSGENSLLTLSGLDNILAGSYTLSITGVNNNETTTIDLYLSKGIPEFTELLLPLNNSEIEGINPTCTWSQIYGADYIIEIAADANFTEIVLSDTTTNNSYTITEDTLLPNNPYYWRVYASNQCGTSISSSTFVFNTGSAYCPYITSSIYEWIDSISIADVQNYSGPNNDDSDFTDLTINVIAGESYDVHLQQGFLDVLYQESWAIWIDVNKDGVFSQFDERFLSESFSFNDDLAPINSTISIPDTIELGKTTLRIGMRWIDSPSPCGANNSFGEYEDYSIVIRPNCEDTDDDFICDTEDSCMEIDNTLIGTACDDNDAATVNDIYTEDCGCVGIFYCNGDLDMKPIERQGALYANSDFSLDGNETYTWYNEADSLLAFFIGNPYYSPQQVGTYTVIVKDPDNPNCQQMLGPKIINKIDGCCELDD